DRAAIEDYLQQYLGVTKILWLGDGIVGDDTDGHVDDLTRFVDERTVVTAVERDPDDENYEPLQDNLKRLRTMKDQDGQALEVITLPMPRPLEHDGQRLPASYANFYIANGVVLLPTYDRERDPIAIDVLQRCFPDRRVVGIDCTDLVWGLGAFHCVSQQWPAL
ncbi:MAG: agmatine/peptidylarginine deiminase, partial [Gemmatimonadales bacterium]